MSRKYLGQNKYEVIKYDFTKTKPSWDMFGKITYDVILAYFIING